MAEPTAPACPVAALARESRALAAAHIAADGRMVKLKDGPERVRLDKASAVLTDCLAAIEPAAGQVRAASPEEALFQLGLALDAARRLADMSDEDCLTDARRLRRRVEGLLWSVAGLLEAQAGVGWPEAAGSYYLGNGSSPDPHATLEAARQGAAAPGGTAA